MFGKTFNQWLKLGKQIELHVSHAFSLHHSVSFLMVNIVMIVMMINGVGNVAGDDGDGDDILKWNS